MPQGVLAQLQRHQDGAVRQGGRLTLDGVPDQAPQQFPAVLLVLLDLGQRPVQRCCVDLEDPLDLPDVVDPVRRAVRNGVDEGHMENIHEVVVLERPDELEGRTRGRRVRQQAAQQPQHLLHFPRPVAVALELVQSLGDHLQGAEGHDVYVGVADAGLQVEPEQQVRQVGSLSLGSQRPQEEVQDQSCPRILVGGARAPGASCAHGLEERVLQALCKGVHQLLRGLGPAALCDLGRQQDAHQLWNPLLQDLGDLQRQHLDRGAEVVPDVAQDRPDIPVLHVLLHALV
mmetsp:Transcript_6106/g.21848  ORF Transcript_6106/g.21848 Transcript_6106/m.21848 type:complete len:287 (+) Transcript_6106:2275-3135(+)